MSESKHPYGEEFFDGREAGIDLSARRIVPLVIDLVDPRSVVDVGCGDAAWLAVFYERGVRDIRGFDGAWVATDRLKVDARHFEARDLNRPIRCERRFDLVVSLEVAEHLEPEAAERFVDDLTSLGPCVLFSAAVRFQGGVGHLNEQWQSYWAELFRQRGYVAVDCIRWRIWDDEQIAWWYRQNTVLYVHHGSLGRYPELQREYEVSVKFPLSIVHPVRYERAARPREVKPDPLSLSVALKAMPRLVGRALVGRMRRLFRGSKRRE